MLKGSVTLSLLSCLPWNARHLIPRGDEDRILVIVQQTGGNDGLNTIIPYGNDAYHAARPVLRVAPSAVAPLDDYYGLHPAFKSVRGVWDQGNLHVINGVGYPNPNRSHFRSMEIWHTASTEDIAPTSGWLGKVTGHLQEQSDLPVIRVGDRDLPLALVGAPVQVPAIAQANDLQLKGMAQRPRSLLEQAATDPTNRKGRPLSIATATKTAFEHARRLEKITARPLVLGQGELGRAFGLASQLISSGLGPRILYITQGGYDTHARQGQDHPDLLYTLGIGLSRFQAQLETDGIADRVVTFVFSEFGRRITENASGGTDHGAGNPVLLLGQGVRGGLSGGRPSLLGGSERDVPLTTDFRQIYLSLLKWLDLPYEKAVPGSFSPLSLFM